MAKVKNNTVISGLDRNDLHVGPNHFPVRAQVFNAGDALSSGLCS